MLRTVLGAPHLPMAYNVAYERGPFPDPQQHLHAVAHITTDAPLVPSIYTDGSAFNMSEPMLALGACAAWHPGRTVDLATLGL